MDNFKKKLKKTLISIFCFLFRWSKERPVVLLYHSINNQNHFLSISPEIFEKQIKFLKEKGFKFLRVEDLVHLEKLERKSVLITFDDGYKDNFLNAVPILEKYQIPALFFISVNLLGKEMKGLPIMNWQEVKEISSHPLFEIGSHCLNHFRLVHLTPLEIEKEVKESKKILEEELKRPIRAFAYPYGRYNNLVIEKLKEANYQYAFTIEIRRLRKKENLFLLPRLGINQDNCSMEFFEDLFKPGFELYWKIRRSFLE